MVKYDDLPEYIRDIIADAYYDGIIHDDLHTFLINDDQLLVVPLNFPEMEGKYLRERLDDLGDLDEFREFARDNEIPLYTTDNYTEDIIEDFSRSTYEVIKERFAEDYVEDNFDDEMTKYMGGYK